MEEVTGAGADEDDEGLRDGLAGVTEERCGGGDTADIQDCAEFDAIGTGIDGDLGTFWRINADFEHGCGLSG